MISLQQLDVIAHNASKDPCCCVTQLKLLLLFLEHALFKGCCLAEGNQLQFFTIITIVINIIITIAITITITIIIIITTITSTITTVKVRG